MVDINKIKDEITSLIKSNGVGAITGPILQQVLLDMSDEIPVNIEDLYNVVIFEPKQDHILRYDGVKWTNGWQLLSRLFDVNIMNLKTGQILVFDGTNWDNADPRIENMFDVLLDSQISGQILKWDEKQQMWINADPLLSELFDVMLGNPKAGQILQWNGEKWVNADPVITGLFDSTITSPEAGENLEYDGENWKNTKPLLSKLFDVTISALENNNVLEYDSASGMWKNSSNFYTKSQIDEIIKNAISAVLRFQGTSSSQISDGSTTNPIVINGKSVTVVQGDVVLYGNKEFVWTGSAWEELGDEASWALKTITITGTGYLTGGGNLSANRTIDLTQDAKTKIEHGESVYNNSGNYALKSTSVTGTGYLTGGGDLSASRSIDLADAYKTQISHGESAYQTILSGGNKSYEEMTAAAYAAAAGSGGIRDGVLYVIVG